MIPDVQQMSVIEIEHLVIANAGRIKSIGRGKITKKIIAMAIGVFLCWGFREILEHGAASLLQPDPCHAGGISWTDGSAPERSSFPTGTSRRR